MKLRGLRSSERGIRTRRIQTLEKDKSICSNRRRETNEYQRTVLDTNMKPQATSSTISMMVFRKDLHYYCTLTWTPSIRHTQFHMSNSAHMCQLDAYPRVQNYCPYTKPSVHTRTVHSKRRYLLNHSLGERVERTREICCVIFLEWLAPNGVLLIVLVNAPERRTTVNSMSPSTCSDLPGHTLNKLKIVKQLTNILLAK